MNTTEYETLRRSIDALQVAVMELEKELVLVKRTNLFLYEKCYIGNKGKEDL